MGVQALGTIGTRSQTHSLLAEFDTEVGVFGNRKQESACTLNRCVIEVLNKGLKYKRIRAFVS